MVDLDELKARLKLLGHKTIDPAQIVAVPVDALLGIVFSSVVNKGDDAIVFTCDGYKFRMKHVQDCCESVTVDDICGDLNDLVGERVIMAEVVTNSSDPPRSEYDKSFLWTFYKIGTSKGSVTIRWYGHSSGYYSEAVSIILST